MAAQLKGGRAYQGEPHDTGLLADEARQEALAVALGQASSAAYDEWQAGLPDDQGPAAPLAQPSGISRFDAATFTWRGGSNAADNPRVAVQRRVRGTWKPFADQSGEVQTMVEFPHGVEGLVNTYAGNTEWQWTANFEAFDAFPTRLGRTPIGIYRFVVDGAIRQDGEAVPYRLKSEPFTVSHWKGVALDDPRVSRTGSSSFTAASVYPRTYQSRFPFIADDGRTDVCKTCTFRPWAAGADVASAVVTVTRADGRVEKVPARLRNGRWVAPTALNAGDTAVVAPGAVRDANGETNGEALVIR